MLNILSKVFDKLNNEKLDYIIYKGLSHLGEDLNGDRGDIDILIDKKYFFNFLEILKSENIFLSSRSNGPYYFVGIDSDTHKFILLDIDTKIQFGPKPYKPFYLNIDIEKLKIFSNKNNLRLLDNSDYIPLMFFMRILSLSEKKKDLEELQSYLQKNNLEDSYIKKLTEDITQESWKNINNKILNASNWSDLKIEFKEKIKNNSKKNISLTIKQKFKYVFAKFSRIKSILKTPPYKIRQKGYLVAFIGVDGAGKSSTVEYIENLDYFKYTGVKRIYFGNNEYWIPGVVWGLANVKNRWIKIFFALLAHADRSLRSLYAYYYIQRGYIVIADRFYYDNFIGFEMRKANIKPTKSIFKKIYRNIFKPKIWIEPDLTIFLDVSPDVAYSRKQDYSYEMMLEVNLAYKNYMPSVKNVVIVNADNNQEIIYDEVVSNILKLENR